MGRGACKNIFISSIHQDAGKTTLSLGLYKALQERGMKVAFLKPVGQRTVSVGDREVDKDSYLMGSVYRCGRQMPDMSPVTIGRGFTREYILAPRPDLLRERIRSAYRRLRAGKDAVIIEGTGHAGVGAVVDLSNARVAALLGAKVLIVSEGGIGRSIDEIVLNKALFDLHGVPLAGVIINKVLPEKMGTIETALRRGLERLGVRVLGVIPKDPILSAPPLNQIRERLQLELLCGEEGLDARVQNIIVAAMEPYNMVHYLRPGTLVLTSGDRIDNIMTAVSSHLVAQGDRTQVAGIILSGGLVPDMNIISLLRKSRIPIFVSRDDTYTLASRIEHLICKIQRTDRDKIRQARRLVKRTVDIDALLAGF